MTNKSWSKIEYRPESRAENRNSFYKDSSETDNSISHQKNNIPKPGRPSVGGHEYSTYVDYNKHKKETEAYVSIVMYANTN